MQVEEILVITGIAIPMAVCIINLERATRAKTRAKKDEDLFLAGRAIARAKGKTYESEYLRIYNECVCKGFSKRKAIRKAMGK